MGKLRLNYIKLDFCTIYQTLLSQVKRNLVTQQWGTHYLNVVPNRLCCRKMDHKHYGQFIAFLLGLRGIPQ